MGKNKFASDTDKNVQYINEDVNYQFRPFVTCPLPLKQSSKRDINEGKCKTVEYRPLWEKIVGNEKVSILGHPSHGFPYGQDILNLLYLIKKAIEQNNNGLIEFKSMKEFIDTFDLSYDGRTYAKFIKGFKRLYWAQWNWEKEDRGEDVRYGFKFISSWRVYFSEQKGSLQMFDSYIKLSDEFWNLIKKYHVPYNLDIVRQITETPTLLNLYLFLVYRTYINWKKEKKEIFIPFFGPNGLTNQLSLNTTAKRNLRIEFRNQLEDLKKVWEDCPVNMKKVNEKTKNSGIKSKKYEDGYYIQVKNVAQLSVSPHWDKELRQALEESRKTENKVVCPKCNSDRIIFKENKNFCQECLTLFDNIF